MGFAVVKIYEPNNLITVPKWEFIPKMGQNCRFGKGYSGFIVDLNES
jgi:hypothetical protein